MSNSFLVFLVANHLLACGTVTCQSHDQPHCDAQKSHDQPHCDSQKSHDLPSSRPQQYSSVTMKAIRVHEFGGPEVLKYESEVPLPQVGPEEVLIQVKSVGINPVETYIRSGQYARLPSLPFTPGGDCSGIIHDLGPSVKTLVKGQRVFTSKTITGSYAEYTLAAAKYVHPLPDEMTFPQGAALPTPYLTSYRALITKGDVRAGQLVLVHGASGGVGIAAVQIARAYGGIVIGTAGTDNGMTLVEKAGAHFTLNHRKTGYIDKIRDIAKSNGGVDIVLENNAHLNLAKDLSLLAKGGKILVVGNRGTIEINPRDAMLTEANIMGVLLWHATDPELTEAHNAIQAGITNKWLYPIIGKEFPLENASDAHQDIIHGKGALAKMVLNAE